MSLVPTVALGFLVAVAALAQPVEAAASLCEPLRHFVKSVRQNESRIIAFHTIWGTGFKDDADQSLWAKRCDHGGYAPAKPVCAYLMEHGVTEFSGNNVKDAIGCLSGATRFAPGVVLDGIVVSFSYGTADRGSSVQISLSEDADIGGMVMVIKADGY